MEMSAPHKDGRGRVFVWGNEIKNRPCLFTAAEVNETGRKFYESVTLNVSSDPNSQKLFISLYDCLAVKTQDHQDVETAETSRVLALFQDSRGEDAGVPQFRGRWLFEPQHLVSEHPEHKRKRVGLERKEMFEACDMSADIDNNYLEGVLGKREVLCTMRHKDYRSPSPAELRHAHSFVAMAWHDAKAKVLCLNTVVDADQENRKRLQLARIHLHEIFPPRFRLVAQAQAVSQVDPAAARSSAPRAALRAPPREPTPDVPEDQPATPEEPTPPATGQQPYCIISIDSDDEVCEVRARSCPAPSCVRSVVVAEGVVRLFG